MEDDSRFEVKSVLGAYAPEQPCFCIMNNYRGSYRRCEACMQETLTLMERRRKGDRHIMSTRAHSSSRSVVHSSSSKCTKKGGGLLKPIRTVRLDKIVRHVAKVGIKDERSKNMITLVTMFEKHEAEVFTNLINKRSSNQSCAPRFRNV